jgi:hypothetical protein
VKKKGGIKFDFANPIDTRKRNQNDTAQSPPNIQKIGAPVEVNLNIVC